MSVITYQALPAEVKKIANESLGVGVLSHLMSYDYSYRIIIKINSGVLVGFALYHLKELTFANGNSRSVGVVDCVCVDKQYRGEGFGRSLTLAVLRKMAAKNVSRIEVTVKRPAGNASVNSDCEVFWLNLGFHRVKVFKGYFMKDGGAYDCALCHEHPDSCEAVLLSIDSLGAD